MFIAFILLIIMDEKLEKQLFEKYEFLRPTQDRSIVEKNMEIMAKQMPDEKIKDLEDMEESLGHKGLISDTLQERKNKHDPEIYGEEIEPINDLMVFGIQCDNGWYNLLDELFYNIQNHLNKHPELKETFKIEEVKEKYGTLRVYYYGGDDYIDKLVTKAEKKSGNICEVCGAKGKLCTTASDIAFINNSFYKVPSENNGWYKTLCKADAEKLHYMYDKEKISDSEAYRILVKRKAENDDTLANRDTYSDEYIEYAEKENRKIEKYLDILKKRL